MEKLLTKYADKEGERYCLKYLDTTINVKQCVTNETIESVMFFFQLYLEKSDEWSKESLTDIYFYDFIEFEKDFCQYCGEVAAQKTIRISSVKQFNLSVKEYISQGYHIFVYDDNETAIIMDDSQHRVYLFLSQTSEIAIVELLRDIIIKDQENKGSVILHAAAVEKDNKVVAISGIKGAGKSTATMELLFHAGYHFFTGDKLFVRFENEKLIAKGWPDYPHLGVGTISRYSPLVAHCEAFDIRSKKPSDKILLSPKEFYGIEEIKINANVGEVSAVIFPEFNVSGESEVSQVENVAERLISNIEYKEDFPMSKWHELVKPGYVREVQEKKLCHCLASVPGFVWKGNFAAESMEDCLKNN